MISNKLYEIPYYKGYHSLFLVNVVLGVSINKFFFTTSDLGKVYII